MRGRVSLGVGSVESRVALSEPRGRNARYPPRLEEIPMRARIPVLILGGLLLVSLAACSTTARSALAPTDVQTVALKPIVADQDATAFVKTNDYYPAPCTAPCPAPYTAPCPAPCPVPCPAPCPMPCYEKKGLPCEQGCSNFHVRGVVGVAFPLGDDFEGDPNLYGGADIGWTSPCCWGIDAYFRTHCHTMDRMVRVPGAGFVEAEDAGHWYHVGGKVTYQRSFCDSACWFWYAGLGAAYTWSDGYIVDEEGTVSGFGELGVGYRLGKSLRLRAGVEVIGLSSEAAHLTPAQDADERLIWFVSPVVGLEFTF